MRHGKRSVGCCSLLMALMILVSCKTGPYSPSADDVVHVNVSTSSIIPGGSLTLNFTGSLANGLSMPDNVVVQLKVDKGSFVNSKGTAIDSVVLISGKAQAIYQSDPKFAGPAATITVSCGVAKVIPAEIPINIENVDVTQLFISADPLLLPITGGEATITATALNKDMVGVANKQIWFETTAGRLLSSSPVVTDSQGKAVIKLDTTLTATVTATLNDLKKDIKVEVKQPPTPGFTISPTNPISGETVWFNPAETKDIDSTYETCDWDFGDGTLASNQALNIISHTYHVTEEKIFTVTLTAKSSKGFMGVVSKEVTIRAMQAIFTWSPVPPKVNSAVTFNASNSQGKIRWYRWSFGDGGTKETEYPSYTYAGYKAAGFYDVTLTILGEGGEVATSTMRIKVVD